MQVQSGEKLCADIRMINVVNFKVDNSSLTGEPEEQPRGLDRIHDNPLEAFNLAFFGTLAVNGEATAIVVQVGDQTVIGNIARLTTATSDEQTTLGIEIASFVHMITVIALVLGVIFFLLKLFKGTNSDTDWLNQFTEALVFGIGIIVANVPEGLLTTVTVSLTLTATRMRKRKVMVKNLETVETLGSCSCICSDKTGTRKIQTSQNFKSSKSISKA